MHKSKTNPQKANQTKKQGGRGESKKGNVRSDYNQKKMYISSDEESEDLMVYEWSQVIPIYTREESNQNVFTAEIDTEHMKTATKGAKGRPVQTWDFIFSPEKFDREIGLSQFNGDSLPFDKL